MGKDPDAGKDRGQEEKGATEDEMVGWHPWLNGHEFDQTPEDSEEQGSLACCSPRGQKELDMTEQMNNNSKSDINYINPRQEALTVIAGVDSMVISATFMVLFIYLLLFLAVPSLHCCMGFLVWASHCSGFYCCKHRF